MTKVRLAKKVPTTVYPLDRTNALSFTEQDKIINELRDKNTKSNKTLSQGLAGLSALISALWVFFYKSAYEISSSPRPKILTLKSHSYFLYIWEYLQPSQPLLMPVVPIPTDPPIHSVASFPLISVAFSIITLGLSIYYILTYKDLSETTPAAEAVSFKVLQISSGTGLVGVALALGTSWVELLFWALPLLVVLLDFTALRMMRDIENGVKELEKVKYNFKGAWITHAKRSFQIKTNIFKFQMNIQYTIFSKVMLLAKTWCCDGCEKPTGGLG